MDTSEQFTLGHEPKRSFYHFLKVGVLTTFFLVPKMLMLNAEPSCIKTVKHLCLVAIDPEQTRNTIHRKVKSTKYATQLTGIPDGEYAVFIYYSFCPTP